MSNRNFLLSLLAFVFSLAFFACEESNRKEPEKYHYVLKVNYISQTGQIPPTDTLEVVSEEEPRLFVDEGTSVLIADSWARPIASYVRSFRIISKTPL
jgi:hypothetical protein